MDLIDIDGAFGEGGGQIVRTSLGLALLTGAPVEIRNVRAGRGKPGLLRQHLCALKAATEIGEAEVKGAKLGSGFVRFTPKSIKPGQYSFDVGSAGSATLVLQTVLPALLSADAPSELTIIGGTDNPYAPPIDFLKTAFAPLLARMGGGLKLDVERRGYYPRGGGRFVATITPGELKPITLTDPVEHRVSAIAYITGLKKNIATRELSVLREALSLTRDQLRVVELDPTWGPGNTLSVSLEAPGVTEVVTGFGEKRVRAETVAERVVEEARAILDAKVPVGEHLADQLLLLCALAGGGSFLTLPPSLHTRTQATVLKRFLPIEVELNEVDASRWRVDVSQR